MTKEFKQYIKPNEPTVRIGERVPPTGVNLAFVDSPSLSPDMNVQIFDYSGRIPANSLPLHNFESSMSVDDEGVLVDPKGNNGVPINNLIITDVYKQIVEDSSKKFVPLYYKSVLRFKHFEKEPPMKGGFYVGQNITVLENGAPSKRHYLIQLEMVIDNVFTVTIFSEFISSEDRTFSVRYTRYISHSEDLGDYKYRPDFEETLKSSTIFTNAGDSEYAIDKVLNLQESGLFATNRFREDSYVVFVPDRAGVYERSPIIFRWRIKKDNQMSTPWRQETLYNKSSLHDVEWRDHNNKPLYFDILGKAKKLLIFDARDAFDSAGTTYSFEYEVWDNLENRWVNDGAGKVIVDNPKSGIGPVYVHTDYDTVPANTDNTTKTINYPSVATPLTIEGYMPEAQENIIPANDKNMSQISMGASISTSSLSSYPIRNAISRAIDGVDLSRVTKLSDHMFSAQTPDSKNPQMTEVRIDVTLPGSGNSIKAISDLEFVLGEKGNIKSAKVYSESNSLLEQATSSSMTLTKQLYRISSSESISTRKYKWSLSTERNVKRIELTITPSKWKTRDYWWIFELLGIRDKYRCGIEVAQINAWHRDPGSVTLTDWGKIGSYTVNVSKNSPYTKKLKDIINDLELTPPSEIEPGLVRYRIFVGGDSGSAGYDNLTTINLRSGSGGRYFFENLSEVQAPPTTDPHEQSVADINYLDLIDPDKDISLSVRTDRQELYLSKIFTLKADDNSSIKILPIEGSNSDSMWGVTINNGRFVINDYLQNKLKDYFLPEFGMQPFHPEFPYISVIGEKASFINDSQIKILNAPLQVGVLESGEIDSLSLAVYKEHDLNKPLNQRRLIPVKDWNKSTGDIFLDEEIQFTERIYVDYIYEAKKYTYRGYYDKDKEKFYHLDLNPMPGHKYTSFEDEELHNSSKLLNKDVYLYIIPAYVINTNADPNQEEVIDPVGGELLSDNYIQSAESTTLRHTIVSARTPEIDVINSLPEDSILLGKVLVRNPYSPSMTTIIDTRRRGGGFKDDLSPQSISSFSSESGYVWDVASWDGFPYPSNGVVVITLPKSVLQGDDNPEGFTDYEIKKIVEDYIALGAYPIIRYTD